MKKKKLTQKEMVDNIMDNFDFERVHNTMHLLDWRWAEIGVPSEEKIKREAWKHLDRAIEQVLSPYNTESKDVAYMSASGGLVARAWKTNKNNLSRLELDFVLTGWESDRK
jgi:hypothetical protein